MANSQASMPPVLRILGHPLSFLTNIIQNMNVTGLSNIPETGPMIIAANHTGFLDPLLIGVPLFQRGIPPRFAAKSGLFSVPVLGWLLEQAQQIPIHRRTDAPQLSDNMKIATGLEEMHTVLDEGSCLCIFPEGTFTHDPDGWAMRAKTGIARLILAHPDATVIPVAHWGNERLIDPWTKHINWRMFGRKTTNVYVNFGKPLDFSEYQGREITKELLQEVSDVVMDAINDALEILRSADITSRGIARRDHLWDRREDADGDPLALFDQKYYQRTNEKTAGA